MKYNIVVFKKSLIPTSRFLESLRRQTSTKKLIFFDDKSVIYIKGSIIVEEGEIEISNSNIKSPSFKNIFREVSKDEQVYQTSEDYDVYSKSVTFEELKEEIFNGYDEIPNINIIEENTNAYKILKDLS